MLPCFLLPASPPSYKGGGSIAALTLPVKQCQSTPETRWGEFKSAMNLIFNYMGIYLIGVAMEIHIYSSQ